MEKQTRLVGTEIKLNVHMEPIGDVHMSMCPFSIYVYAVSGKGYEIKKEECILVDSDNYIVVVDTSKTGEGVIRLRYTVDLPDADISDGFRREIILIDTGIQIRRA
jgi:hypothetical protein